MSLNVIDLIKGQLGPALISQAASQFGESESGISKAISGLLPSVVGGLANNSSNPAVLDAIKGAHSTGLLGNLFGGSADNSVVSNLLPSIFGDKLSSLVSGISSFAGIGNSSSHSLLNMVTGATLGSIGKFAADNNLDHSGISKLLSDQKGIISTLLPAGLTLGALGFGHWGHSVSSAATNIASEASKIKVDTPKVDINRGGSAQVHTIKEEKKGGSIWKWLLPLLLLLFAAWFLWRQCNKKSGEPTTTTTTTTDSTNAVANDTLSTSATTADTAAVKKELTDIDLNGTKLKGLANGMEAKMIDFLKADGYKNAADDEALKTTWYDFDNVNFVFGKSDQITEESKGQLENLAAILKAYPDAKIKIGGYTDRKGDDKLNKALSQKRADFIKAELAKLGVGAQITGAEGYGEEFAKVDENASDAERAKDRKMAVRFAK